MEDYARCQNEKLALLQHEVRASRKSSADVAASLCSAESCPLMANAHFRAAVTDHLQPLHERVGALEGALRSAQNDIGQLSSR